MFLDILSGVQLSNIQYLECRLSCSKLTIDRLLQHLLHDHNYNVEWTKLQTLLEQSTSLETFTFALQHDFQDDDLLQKLSTRLQDVAWKELPKCCEDKRMIFKHIRGSDKFNT